MEWLETIRVLGSRESAEALLDQHSSLLEHLGTTGGRSSIALFSRDGADPDLLVCIQRRQDESPTPSQEGLLLAEYLSDFGMVRHEVWRRRDGHLQGTGAAAARAPQTTHNGTPTQKREQDD